MNDNIPHIKEHIALTQQKPSSHAEYIAKRNEWDQYFLRIAEVVSSKSKDPSTKVGAVLVNFNKSIISTGYNGMARRVQDLPERYSNREYKYKTIIHGEINALIFAKKDVSSSTLYTVPFPPCAACSSIMIQAGVIRIVSYSDDIDNPRWGDAFNIAKQQYDEAGVELTLLSKSTGA